MSRVEGTLCPVGCRVVGPREWVVGLQTHLTSHPLPLTLRLHTKSLRDKIPPLPTPGCPHFPVCRFSLTRFGFLSPQG